MTDGYDRLDDTGGSSFLCFCKKGADTDGAEHEDWCHAGILSDLLAAGQELHDATDGNARAEAATAWEEAVERVANHPER